MKISLIGSGSAFAINIAETLDHKVFDGCTFMLMDIHQPSLDRGKAAVETVLKKRNLNVKLETTTFLERAVDGCHYVIVSSELDRYRNWVKDIEIPERYGVFQETGENGGPGGQIHAMRNIGMLMPIVAAMNKYCPNAWLLNLTNPMSILCTYLKYTPVRSMGFCHQVHGSIGVISEQLGFEPGELEVVSGGINHLNWMFDLRRRSTGESYLEKFHQRIQESKWWSEQNENVPDQRFSLEIFNTFGMYPIGYDNHICEYFSCYYDKEEWKRMGIKPCTETRLKPMIAKRATTMGETIKAQHLIGGGEGGLYPFPKDPRHSYYRETVCAAIVALETNVPLYLDAMVGRNDGAISNLPDDAVVDRPVVIVGGECRSVHVGKLPSGPLEVCRRQIAIHEMVVQATLEGDEKLAVQALCLDPYVNSITQARAIWRDYRKEYNESLFMFH